MATVRKRIGKKGKVSYQLDYYDPQGKRIMKCFAKKGDAEAYGGKAEAAKREGRYEEIFDVKKGTKTLFNELADKYVENFGTQKSFQGFKSHVVRELREYFDSRKLSEITYLDLETFRNRRKAAPTKAGKTRTDASVNRDMAILGHILSKASGAC